MRIRAKTSCFFAIMLATICQAKSELMEAPLTCDKILQIYPLPYPDGRVGYYCDRAFYACQLLKMTNLLKEDLTNAPDSKEKSAQLKEIEMLAHQTRSERQIYLAACRFTFNFLTDSRNVQRVAEPGL